ncbi:MAG: hypothetical protein QOK11_2832 [Pseudonocardiales bacterium]|nr:hypothetical protein [Pseudonocardiales bacterium]
MASPSPTASAISHGPAGSTTPRLRALTIGDATVKTHVARILQKLGVRDRVQAVIAAYRSGLAYDGAPTSD